MKDPRVVRLRALMAQDEDVRRVVRIVCDAQGASSPDHLLDLDPEMLEEVLAEAESLVAQGSPYGT